MGKRKSSQSWLKLWRSASKTDMDNNRQSFSDNRHIVLVNEASGLCQLCGTPLMYNKDGSIHRGYDIAHIYPLNPSKDEVALLSNETKLCDDLNGNDNLIPLCKSCHGKLDKPRTVYEYRKLVKIKKGLIVQARQRADRHLHRLEDDVRKVISTLSIIDLTAGSSALSYDPKTIDEKTDNTISQVTKIKIKQQVSSYFGPVRNELSLLDSSKPGISDLIASQIKTFYLTQKTKGLGQQEIYSNTVDWVSSKCPDSPRDACEIIVSFFVQNCEVFS